MKNQTSGIIVRGHQVASGMNGNPKFPGGTISMQQPFFKQLGLNLSHYYRGTINIETDKQIRLLEPFKTFKLLKWCPEPAETFSFIDAELVHNEVAHKCYIYYPHPETKPEHFQKNNVVEIIAVKIQGISYGQHVEIRVPVEQACFE